MTTLYTIVNSLCLLGIVVSAILAVTLEKPLSASIALGATGAFVSLEFLLLQAPDVAIAVSPSSVPLKLKYSFVIFAHCKNHSHSASCMLVALSI